MCWSRFWTAPNVARSVETFWMAASIADRLIVEPEKLKIDGVDGVARAGAEQLDGVGRDRLAVVRAHLEGDGGATGQQGDAVELGVRADAGDLGAELGDLGRDGGLIGRRQRAVVVLDREVADALQHGGDLTHRTVGRLHEVDGGLGVLLGLAQTADLSGQLLRDGETGGVVGGLVDAVTRGELLHRAGQHAAGLHQVPVGVERLDVGLDGKGHIFLLEDRCVSFATASLRCAYR